MLQSPRRRIIAAVTVLLFALPSAVALGTGIIRAGREAQQQRLDAKLGCLLTQMEIEAERYSASRPIAPERIEEAKRLLHGGANPNARFSQEDVSEWMEGAYSASRPIGITSISGMWNSLRAHFKPRPIDTRAGAGTSLYLVPYTHDSASTLRLIRILLEAGADPNRPAGPPGDKNSPGVPVLSVFAIRDCPEAVRLLLAYHADVNAPDDRGWTPLDNAECFKDEYEKMEDSDYNRSMLADLKQTISIIKAAGGHRGTRGEPAND